MAGTVQPSAVHLFTYRVGFGDCFLLRFEYGEAAGKARHVLIDFGSTAPASKAIGNQMTAVAEHVAETCGGRLDAIVATHRHKDHVSGFAGATWKRIAALEPRLVVLPWTEHPDAATDATVAPSGTRGKIGALSSAHVRSLAHMHDVAAAALKELRRRGGAPPPPDDDTLATFDDEDPAAAWATQELGPAPLGAPFGKELSRQLAFVGDDNLANAAALENLLSTKAQEFLSFGSKTQLEKLLPGVKVHVLGPPTLAQSEKIRGMRTRDPDEFWHVMALAGRESALGNGRALFPGVKPVDADGVPLETRWFLKRVDAVRSEELLQIVRALDDALNNTSLILLFEVRRKKLLFPGDAQIENWAHALADRKARRLLAGVDVYKVGHHGSLNATPKTLWGLFEKRGEAGTRRLRTILSTRAGKHGSAKRGTEVPRRTLVRALEDESELFSTQDLRSKKEFVKVERIA